MSRPLKFAPKSKHIREATYDPDSRSLIVTFHNGSRYGYSGVPMEAWTNWQKYTRSAGEFFSGVIKRYPATKLGK